MFDLSYFISDIIIGVPSLQAQNLDGKIREERCRYLVAELVCRVSSISGQNNRVTVTRGNRRFAHFDS